MTNPTDPRVEAATLALLETDNYDLSLSDTSLEAHLKEPHSGDCTRESHSCLRCICAQAQKEAILIIKAADAAAWLPIESAPKDGETSFDIWVTSKEGGYRISNVMRSDAVWVFDLMEWPDEMVPATHWMPLPTPPKTQ